MKKGMHFVSFLFLFYCLFFASVLIYNKDKINNSYIVIINIVMIIKKIIGGKDATLLGDFALEPLENFNWVFLRIYFC